MQKLSERLGTFLGEETFEIEGGGKVRTTSTVLAKALRSAGIKPGQAIGSVLRGDVSVPQEAVAHLEKLGAKLKIPKGRGGPRPGARAAAARKAPTEIQINKALEKYIKGLAREWQGDWAEYLYQYIEGAKAWRDRDAGSFSDYLGQIAGDASWGMADWDTIEPKKGHTMKVTAAAKRVGRDLRGRLADEFIQAVMKNYTVKKGEALAKRHKLDVTGIDLS